MDLRDRSSQWTYGIVHPGELTGLSALDVLSRVPSRFSMILRAMQGRETLGSTHAREINSQRDLPSPLPSPGLDRGQDRHE